MGNILVAKGQKMAMKNYAKQLNSQIEEVVAEVRENPFGERFLFYRHNFPRFEIHWPVTIERNSIPF